VNQVAAEHSISRPGLLNLAIRDPSTLRLGPLDLVKQGLSTFPLEVERRVQEETSTSHREVVTMVLVARFCWFRETVELLQVVPSISSQQIQKAELQAALLVSRQAHQMQEAVEVWSCSLGMPTGTQGRYRFWLVMAQAVLAAM
jgi:hypothetical protein